MEQLLAPAGGVDWQALLLLAGTAMLRMAVIVVIAWALIRFTLVSLRRLERTLVERGKVAGEAPAETVKRIETLMRLMRQAVIIGVWSIAVLVLLRELGVEIMPILASAGIAGLALGFGAQNLVRDVIAGFFIILENQVRVGDVAVVNGTGGLVEQINFRTMVLRDLTGTVHVFPNGAITTLSNRTRDWSGNVLDIRIAYKEDTDRAVEIMKAVGAELTRDDYFGPKMLQDVEVFGVDDLAESAVILKGRLRTKPGSQWEVGREYRRRLKRAFDDAGITIPFPHQTVYFGDAGDPLAVRMLAEGEEAGRTAG